MPDCAVTARSLRRLSLVTLLGLVTSAIAQAVVEVNCNALSVPTVTVTVPAGATYIARCRHDSANGTLRFLGLSALKVQFRCGAGSSLILDGWQQRNGSLEVVPAVGGSLDRVRIETRNSVVVETTSGHALSFIATSITNSVLSLGDGTTLRGTETAASFLTSSVSHSRVAAGEDCIVSAKGYAAAAVVSIGTGESRVDLLNVTLTTNRGSVVTALGSSSGRTSYIAALGATAIELTAMIVHARRGGPLSTHKGTAQWQAWASPRMMMTVAQTSVLWVRD
jgi:hypothetical protein